MAEHSTIEWTDATWNPITGCTLVSEGCRHCYAATLAATRLKNLPSRRGLARINAAGEAKFTGEVRFNAQWLGDPLRWKRPRRIFVCAHGDLFHEAVPDEWIDQVFAVMALAPRHTFQVLTKRPERAREYLTADGGFGRWGYIEHHARHMAKVPAGLTLANLGGSNLPNIWLGTSVEDQATAEARIPHLLATPTVVRFISAEPLLGPIDLTSLPPFLDISARLGVRIDAIKPGGKFSLDWVIVGGESGPKARPMHPDWARSLRDQCVAAGVAFFFKQWGEWAPGDAFGMTEDRPITDRHGNVRDWMRRYVVCGDDRADRLTAHNFTGHATDLVYSVGKSRAGRLLDGRTWDQMPGDRDAL